jgi:hypothetical protein
MGAGEVNLSGFKHPLLWPRSEFHGLRDVEELNSSPRRVEELMLTHGAGGDEGFDVEVFSLLQHFHPNLGGVTWISDRVGYSPSPAIRLIAAPP